jgi:hypothetical protein
VQAFFEKPRCLEAAFFQGFKVPFYSSRISHGGKLTQPPSYVTIIYSICAACEPYKMEGE